MIRRILRLSSEWFKSPIMWLMSLGVLSDLGYNFSEFTNNSIQRVGVIIADIISMIVK